MCTICQNTEAIQERDPGRIATHAGSRPVYGREPHSRALCGLVVDPGEQLAFSPAQVLADPVGRQLPFSPFVADGALGDSEYFSYFPRGQHAVGSVERSYPVWFRAPPIGGHLLCLRVTV